jgi:hypothetical protein
MAVVEFVKYTAILLSSYAGVKSAKVKLRELKTVRAEKKSKEAHNRLAAVYPILQAALNSYEEIDRVTVFRSHNGDGIPQIGKLSHTSCVQEVHTNKTSPITERWQNIPSDLLQIQCITEMMTNGCAMLPSYAEDCPQGILTDFCRGNGIRSVLAVPITYLEDGFIYLNFCSATCDNMQAVDGILFEARSCAGRVKELIDRDN